MSKTVKTAAKPTVRPTPAATNDAGTVKVGAGMIRFTATKTSTHDAGRVQVGAGMMRF